MIRIYNGNLIHASRQPFNEQNKARRIIFVDLRKVHARCMVDYISNTEVDRNFEGITMLTPQCLSAQALKIHITVCTTIRRESRDFTNDRFQRWKPLVHTSFRKFTKCLQMIRCLEPDRLCGCNNVLSSQPILGILIPEPGPIITVDSFGVKSELQTKMTVLRWFTG